MRCCKDFPSPPRRTVLSDKEQLAVLGQWPEGVVGDELEFVYLVADGAEKWLYSVVIGDGALAGIVDFVGVAAGFDELFYAAFDGGGALCYLFDEAEVAFG